MNYEGTEESGSAQNVALQFAQALGLSRVDFYVKHRVDGPYLIIEVAFPTDRLFGVLSEVTTGLDDLHPFKERVTIMKRRRSPAERLTIPETQMLRKTLSESLTVDRHTFQDDFFSRYTHSVFDFEDQITTNANFVVYGRRGSGKSSLLAFALHSLEAKQAPYAWVAMQAYSGRGDVHVSIDVFLDILRQIEHFFDEQDEIHAVQYVLESLLDESEHQAGISLQKVLPRVRRVIGEISDRYRSISVFVDDFHVLRWEFQPEFLANLYAVSRGNRVHLKVSGIEQFSRLWDPVTQRGLEVPHDTQILKLDYNLTMPDRSRDHIETILDAHAKYCGLPGIGWIAGAGVLSRLVWVAAAVPRDALNLLAQAITKASSQGQKRVSVTSINVAASEMTEQKLKDIQSDVSGSRGHLEAILEQVREFCINEERKNAFLVEIQNTDPVFREIQKLIALRLVHVLHEGITPHEAGRRFMALMLDYGFYVGIRAAKSIDLFQKEPKALLAKDLRRLPIFRGDAARLQTA